MTPGSQNPFRGLRPFEVEDAPFFFGRDEVIDEILDRLDARRAVALIGRSGSGKSSLIRAGVLPVIREEYHGSRIATLRPGFDPVGNLARALDHAGVAAPIETLRASSFGIVDCVRSAGLGRDQVFIIVDQFEEVFRRDPDLGRADDVDFFASLLASSIEADASIHVLVSVRAEMIGELTRLPAFPDSLSRSLVLVPHMSRDQLAEAIERPVEQMHAVIERSCVQRILNDLNDISDPLPRLQHALQRMWESWRLRQSRAPIDSSDYESVGAMSRALDLHADSLLQTMSEPERVFARRILPFLSEEDGGRIYRRPARVREIAAATDTTSNIIAGIIEPYVSAGLIVVVGQPSDDSIVDVASESLFRQWHTLAAWVAEEVSSRNTYRRLVVSATEYAHGRAGLWRNPELAVAERWLDDRKPNSAWAARYDDSPRTPVPDVSPFAAVVKYLEESRQELGMMRRSEAARRWRGRILGVGFGLLVGVLLTLVVMLLR